MKLLSAAFTFMLVSGGATRAASSPLIVYAANYQGPAGTLVVPDQLSPIPVPTVGSLIEISLPQGQAQGTVDGVRISDEDNEWQQR